MKDLKHLSRRDVLATSVAVGVWGGIPDHGMAQAPAQTPPQPGPPRAGAGPGAPGRGPAEPWLPSEGPNNPMGEGKGIHPGRVVWVHNPEVAKWDGVTETLSVKSATGEW